VVMPYLQAEWYIEQLQRKIYDNEGLKMTIPLRKYQSGEVDYVYVVPKIEQEQSLADVLGFVASDSSKTKLSLENGEQINFIPVNKFRLDIPGSDTIHVELKQRALTKGDLALWDIINTNKGKRPVCFTSWIDPEDYGMKNNLIMNGLVYRLNNEKTPGTSAFDMGKIESASAYDILMKKCNWDNMADPNVYFDWHHRRLFASMQLRTVFYRLANQLTEEQKTEQALEVLRKATKTVPLRNWTADYQSILMAALYAKNGAKEEGRTQFLLLANSFEEWLNYLASYKGQQKKQIIDEASYRIALYDELINQAKDTLSEQEITNMKEKLLKVAARFS
jgi:hypothetical protein